ncbi:hypothetical protein Tco_0904793 [Tanacetum coccineum]
MSPENKAHYHSEKEAIHLLLTGIGDEIYSTVDACKTAHDMWIAIARLQQGESLNIQDVKTNLFWEFGKFTSHDGETTESYYSIFYKMMNEMIRNKLTVAIMQVNVQFLQQLQPEWLRFVTIVKKNHDVDIVSYHELFDILKQYQKEVNEIRSQLQFFSDSKHNASSKGASTFPPSPLKKVVASRVVGGTSLFLLYPLDYARTRLANDIRVVRKKSEREFLAPCIVAQPQVNPDSTIAQVEHITPFTYCGTGVQRLYNMLHHVSLEGRHIVVLGLRGGLLGANPIPHRSYIAYKDRRLSISEEALGAFGKNQTFRDKVVNMAPGDSDDVLVSCIENTVEDCIMDSGASFHATYCKEELERFKLRFGKVRLADDKTLDIVDVGDVVLKTSFSTSWTLKDILGLKRRLILVGQLDEEVYHVGFGDQQCMIGMSMLASKGNVLDVRKVDIYFCKPSGLGKQKNLSFIMSEETRKLQRLEQVHVKCLKFHNDGEYSSCLIKFCVENRIVMLKMVPKTPLKFGVAERLSRTFRVESTGLRLRILEEKWRGKDTSLTHLKVFGCDSFVKVKDICGKAMKCTFICNDSEEMRYNLSATDSSILTNLIQKSQVVLVDISENLAENDSIVAEHGLSSEITQSLDASSYTGEGSENNGSFKDSGRSDEEYSEDGASSKEGGSESPQVRRSTRESRAPVRVSAKKKASQRLWMFKVKDEQNSSEKLHEPSYVGALNDASTQHKSEGFQLAGHKENLECILKEILYGLIEAPRLRQLLNVDDMLVVGSDMAEFNKLKWVLIFVEDSWNEEPCSDVHQVGDEREVEVLRSFNWPPSKLITNDGVLPERGYSQFNDVSSGYLVSKVS